MRITPRACVATTAAAFGLGALLAGPGASLALDTGGSSLATTTHSASNTPPAEATVQGSNPHGQGTVLSVSVGGKEAVVVGRSRGEQRSDGTYHGHTTTLGLFGQDVIGNDTGPGQTAKGPLAPLQEQVLDQICKGSSGNICVDVLRADSQTTNTGSTNHSRALGVSLGGAQGINAEAADSNGNIAQNGDCQHAHGDVTLLKLVAGGNPLLDIGESASDSNACPNGTTVHNSQNPLVAVGGQSVPLPGCGANSPGTLIDLSPLVAVACNAGSQAGAGTVGNDAIVATVLQNGTQPTGVGTGAATGAGAVAPAQPAAQNVLAARVTAPKKAAKRNTAARKNKHGRSSGPGAPTSAKTPRTLTAAQAAKLPYTGTDLVVDLMIAAALVAVGLAIRGMDARVRRSS